MRAFFAILVTAALTPSLAMADQCALNDSAINARAVELARKSTSVIEFCEPCRGAVMRGPFLINNADIKNRQVEINGKPIDLAYVFIHTKGDEYTNLGLAAGCTATGVSRVVRSTQKATTPPQAPTLPTLPPRPPPMVRVTSGDDLAATWTISIRTAVSTCSAAPPSNTPPRTATWTIASSNGTLSLMTEQGRELVAAVPTLDRGMLKVELKDAKQSTVFQVNQFHKEQLYGRFLIVEKGCAIVYDITGRRVP